MSAYYNEIDPYAAEWLRNLIRAGHIAPGDVDERSIVDVRPSDLAGYAQCHFFAGIGGWSLALRLAGWPDDRPVWTGSCPCQPFSAAGKQVGFDDERHLWPSWFYLIEKHRPPRIYGEQVASKDALPWLDLVHADLEGTGYAVGGKDLCAAGVGAPHIRQRAWFVADAESGGIRPGLCDSRSTEQRGLESANGSGHSRLANADNAGLERRQRVPQCSAEFIVGPSGMAGGLADTELQPGCAEHERQSRGQSEKGPDHIAELGSDGEERGPSATNGFWNAADWLLCRDGKWRPVEPGTFPLAHGVPARVGKLRAYGNAIVPQVAAEFIRAYAGAQ